MTTMTQLLNNDTHSDRDDIQSFGDNHHGNTTIYGIHGDNEYKDFAYETFAFEHPIYLYIWETLVVITALANIVVILVLLRKRMRSETNWILVAIAISDSLAGLVTLPTFIMVYQREQVPVLAYDHNEFNTDEDLRIINAYLLSKQLCEAFMVSKYFLFNIFLSISIWLTVFLGLQRYIGVAYPFKAKTWLTTKTVLIICGVVFIGAPVMQLFHIADDKTDYGMCFWKLTSETTVHLWLELLLLHLIPCAVLIVTTAFFICHLKKRSLDGNATRAGENRRVTKIVVAILVSFLIPELPSGLSLLYHNIVVHVGDRRSLRLKNIRAIRAGYDVVVIISFHFNFYIYLVFNKRFRNHLRETFLDITVRARRMCGPVLSRILTRNTVPNSNDIAVTLTAKGGIGYSYASKGTEMNTLDKTSAVDYERDG